MLYPIELGVLRAISTERCPHRRLIRLPDPPKQSRCAGLYIAGPSHVALRTGEGVGPRTFFRVRSTIADGYRSGSGHLGEGVRPRQHEHSIALTHCYRRFTRSRRHIVSRFLLSPIPAASPCHLAILSPCQPFPAVPNPRSPILPVTRIPSPDSSSAVLPPRLGHLEPVVALFDHSFVR